MATNYHTHCYFCDGQQEPEAFIQAALAKGFQAIGFSSHAPVPFDCDWTMPADQAQQYFATINALKTKYQNQIEVYQGLEIDYFSNNTHNLFNQYQFDYCIGSIHFIADFERQQYLSIDGGKADFEQTLSYFQGKIQSFVTEYYRLVREMVTVVRPTIIGHFDIIKKNNQNEQFFSEQEKWYQRIVNETLKVVANSGCILEVNTGGILRGYLSDPYPSPWILRECSKLKIPIVLNSDAHSPDKIDGWFNEAKALLRDVGYREQQVLLNSKWITVDL